MRRSAYVVITVVVATILACGFSASTANITDAKMAVDSEGSQSTKIFAQEDTFYAVVEVANAPDDTTVKAVWIAVDVDGVEPDFVIGEKELAGGGTLTYSLSNTDGKLWPAGDYKVDLYLNDELDRTLTFKVEGQAVAEEPTATPEPEPTATPEPEPTDTPEPEPADTVESSGGDSVVGDTLAKPTAAPEEEAEAAEPLPMQAESYVHPSGAFTFVVPQGWEIIEENEAATTFGDNKSFVGVTFFDVGVELGEEDMQSALQNFADGFLGTFADDYELIYEDSNPENKVYFSAYSYESSLDGGGDADIFLEQQDTVIFIFYFVSSEYSQMEPTWDAIIDSYASDAEAAVAAAPAAPAATPPPVEQPKPTPAPAKNSLAPPSGVARVYLQNLAGGEYYIDFGDGSGSIKVVPGAENLFHDVPPGKLTPSISLFGGATTNAEFEIGPDQTWVILLDSDGVTVRWGQVYP